jgi:outer membrane autotransporter protein
MNRPLGFRMLVTWSIIPLLLSVALPATTLAETYSFTGTSTSTDITKVPTIPSPAGTLVTDFYLYNGGSYRYALYTFEVNKTGDYTISAATTSDKAHTMVNTTWIVLGTFSPDSAPPATPLENFIAGVYSGSSQTPPTATLNNVSLAKGTTYSVLTAFNISAANHVLTVDFTFDGVGCVLINGNICIDPAPPPQTGNVGSNLAPGFINVARDFGHSVSGRMGQIRAGGNSVGSPEDIDVLSFFPRANNAGLDAIDSVTLSESQDQALSLWGNAFGNFISNRGNGASPGFSQSAGGFIVGGDALVLEDFWLGAALGYAHSRTVGDGSSGNAEADSYHATLYANWAPGPWFATADLGLTFSQFQTERPALGATAEGQSHMLDASIGGEFGYQFDLNDVAFVPSASLRYDRISAKGYTETGAGAANLTIHDATHHSLRIGIGAEVSKLFALDDDLKLEVSAKARWEHDLLDTGYTTTQSISGADYQVSATDAGRDAAILGLASKAIVKDNLELKLEYNADLRARQTSHTITAGLRFTW